ncbi:MAG: hypothetical protein CMI56_01680 [Parcubacteria group bacterium]|nr:hypothetical protein [Parcubacteria group bacterium]
MTLYFNVRIRVRGNANTHLLRCASALQNPLCSIPFLFGAGVSFLNMEKGGSGGLINSSDNIVISGMVKAIKSITAKKMFEKHPEVKTFLWGRQFWTDGYYINTVGQYGNLSMLENYVKKQGIKNYHQIHHQNLTLF